jgi:hypothetical protein
MYTSNSYSPPQECTQTLLMLLDHSSSKPQLTPYIPKPKPLFLSQRNTRQETHVFHVVGPLGFWMTKSSRFDSSPYFSRNWSLVNWAQTPPPRSPSCAASPWPSSKFDTSVCSTRPNSSDCDILTPPLQNHKKTKETPKSLKTLNLLFGFKPQKAPQFNPRECLWPLNKIKENPSTRKIKGAVKKKELKTQNW